MIKELLDNKLDLIPQDFLVITRRRTQPGCMGEQRSSVTSTESSEATSLY